ncbi:HPP family protein [Alcaligenaceae bacterium SJ-26]|nr:HPP family protein [Alcaligenaceae bacterium SJ-26]
MTPALRRWLQSLRPEAFSIDRREKWRALIGATLGIMITAGLSYQLNDLSATHHYWLVASLGASAILIFLLYSSPLAQPWSVIVGNTLGAAVGITCAILIPNPVLALTAAEAAIILLMFLLRCVHPPSTAIALFAALYGIEDYSFVFFPILFDSCVLVGLGMIYNTLTGKRYPPLRLPAATESPIPTRPGRFSAEDLDTALTRYNQALNISREDLEHLLDYAETASFQRTLGTRTCSAIMSHDPVSIGPEASLQTAWTLMRQHRIKALPVIDAEHHVVGIITVSDFMQQANLDEPDTLGARLKAFIRLPGKAATRKPERVGQIMTTPAVTAHADQPMAALIPLFGEGRHRHMPIVNEQRQLVGMLTQSDLLLDLYASIRPTRAGSESPTQ